MGMEIAIAPSGRLRLEGAENIFAEGNGAGLFRLLADPLPPDAGASCSFFRRLARDYAMRLCRSATGEGSDPFAAALPDRELIEAELFDRPPLTGGEYLNGELLERCHRELAEWAKREFEAAELPFEEWLRKLNPAWRDVGRISFHLAENKSDPDGAHPFLFLATFIHRVSESDQPRHLPLGAALKAYANDRNALLSMLRPIQEAAKGSALIASLLADRSIYRPGVWSAREAYAFLQDIPVFEAANIVVRMANLWKRAPKKLQVQISLDTVGKRGFLSGDSLLRFSVNAAIGGTPLSERELEELLKSGDGLVRLKGEWIEADSEKVGQLLNAWRRAAAAVPGLPVMQGMRLLAGGAVPGGGALPELDRGLCRVEMVGELEKQFRELTAPERMQLPPLPEKLSNTLRPYQLDGVKFLWGMTRIGMGPCLADDMGLGKTLQILTYLELLRRNGDLAGLPALLVLPASLLNNWKNEAEKFTPELKVKLLHPSLLSPDELAEFDGDPAGFLRRYDLVATTYALVTRYMELARLEFPLVIADEAQALKNPGSQQSRAVRRLKGARRIALTGTPVENRLTDLWSIFDFTNPGLLGSLNEFVDFTRRLTPEDGPVNLAPLRRLTGFYILRRLKSDKSIIRDLPDKVELNRFCRLTKHQAVLYQQVVDRMRRELEAADEFQKKGVVLKSLMQFKQLCNHPAQYTGEGDFKAEESGKFLELAELAEKIALKQEKVLVFTQFREMTDPLHELLSRVFGRPGLILHGGTSIRARARLVEAFQKEEGPPFFVLSLKAAGTGLNLTAASHVIHFDRWWNPAVENQATDRAYRIGQHRNVLVHKFICSGTIEEKINSLIWSKRKLADSVVTSGGEVPLTELDTSELLELVKLDIHHIEV